jgi:hypothetical protein
VFDGGHHGQDLQQTLIRQCRSKSSTTERKPCCSWSHWYKCTKRLGKAQWRTQATFTLTRLDVALLAGQLLAGQWPAKILGTLAGQNFLAAAKIGQISLKMSNTSIKSLSFLVLSLHLYRTFSCLILILFPSLSSFPESFYINVASENVWFSFRHYIFLERALPRELL